MSIGSRIKELRLAHGLTQAQLGEAIGVTKAAVGNYEKDLSSPREDTLIAIFDVLDCDANYLFQDIVRERPDTSGTFARSMTPAEVKLVLAYRSKPDMQAAVDRLLGLADGDDGRTDALKSVKRKVRAIMEDEGAGQSHQK